MYEPQEDSYLLEKEVKEHAFGKVLDVGTGTGIQARAASGCEKVAEVLGVDIDKEAVDYCIKKHKETGIKFIESDLFSNVDRSIKFDTIIFNPPYLPQDPEIEDIALYGGKKGYEVVVRFLCEMGDHLKRDGIVLLLFSSLTNKEIVEREIERNLFAFEELSKEHKFFEDLYVYKIEKQDIRKKIEVRGVTGLSFLDRGRRGFVFRADLDGKRVAIKVKNPNSSAVARIGIERDFLKKVNEKGIGPRLIDSDEGFIVMEFIEGVRMDKFINNCDKKKLTTILDDIKEQMIILDKMKVEKQEMIRPFSNVLIRNKDKKPILIDFERCKYSKNPKNLRQFQEFLRRLEMGNNDRFRREGTGFRTSL
jgi:HemK-related putative methylase